MVGMQRQIFRSFQLLVSSVSLISSLLLFAADDTKPGPRLEPGLVVTFSSLNSGVADDVDVFPNAAIYVPAGGFETPFLPAGRFSSEWNGFVSVELRDNYTFQAELSGAIKLEINGVLVLEATANGINSEPSKPVRLNKGTNAFKLHFTGPPEGDSFFRLLWSSREFPMEPISPAALTHESTSPLQKAEQLRLGRELFVENRCAKCHARTAGDVAMPELSMDAPSFEGIGSRRQCDWMARWILDPKSLRPTAHMPVLLRGPKASEDAEAIAAYLASLKSDEQPLSQNAPLHADPNAPASADLWEETPRAGQVEAGKDLFEKLHCVACHNGPGTADNEPQKISLAHVREKFASGGSLVRFLLKPDEHYLWIRMPHFKLNTDEATQLAAFLGSAANKSNSISAPADAAVIERGKKLVQTSGCLNCHSLKIENQFTARTLAELQADKWTQGCLAELSDADSRAPRFDLDAAGRAALRAFGSTDRASLLRHVPTEFAQRQTRLLNCRECHGKFEGFPPLEILGGKLRPEWSKRFIGGEIAIRPRFWLDARMPAFHQRAEGLAAGMAMLHGYPPRTPTDPPIDQEVAKVGQKLVATPPNGFACVQCHGVAKVGATQVFESNGINLALTGDRLLKPYYRRWLRNPLRIDPSTKMPVYFDEEGRSPLTDVYGGDGARQISAIWEYIRLGDEMPPPPGTQPPL